MSQNISVQSLGDPDRDGYMTKQGFSVKSWHRRWFVLKSNSIYYFKKKTDAKTTGVIHLNAESFVRREEYKKKNCIAVGTTGRVFYMYPDTDEEASMWIDAIQKNLDSMFNSQIVESVPTTNEMDVRGRLNMLKTVIPFMSNDKINDFCGVWFDSIPSAEDISDDDEPISFYVSTSADMRKVSWRSSGPQGANIQNMVDFFWSVGAPEEEIDRLNDVGLVVNPSVIGSWIVISDQEGMDGGWYFPIDIDLENALVAADSGTAKDQFSEWLNLNGITQVSLVGRDMGSAPPRQTEFKFQIPGETSIEKIEKALSALEVFRFPPFPEDALNVMRDQLPEDISIHTSLCSDGFVQIGIITPAPSPLAVAKLKSLCGANSNITTEFQNILGVAAPNYVEYQYLNKGYGYGVYNEGFDIILHFDAGIED